VTTEDDWQRWRERYNATHNGVLRLFHDRAIWRTILAMLNANPAVARGGFGEYWLGSCYTASQLIGIRRETGADSQSIGIRRSLNSLASSPRMATRAWYRQQVAEHGHPEEDPDRLFNRFAGPAQPFIDSGLVRTDIAALEAVITRVNSYTSKTLAHRDDDISRGAPSVPDITWGELDAAIDAVGNIHKKYYSLCHPGETLGCLTPLMPPGWTQMFATALMPPEFSLPPARSFEPPLSANY
jgi:hypothetical protein